MFFQLNFIAMRFIICILLFGCIGINRCFAAEPIIMLEEPSISTTTNSLDIELFITNKSKNTQQCEVDIVIKETDGKTFIRFQPQTHFLKAGENKTLKFNKKYLKPNLWSPEYPFLYQMHTNIIVHSNHVVKDIRKIGFKSFEVCGHLFYLNGKPYYLRGLSQWPVSRIIDENGVIAPEVWEDEAFVKKFFQKAKDLNINAGRIGDHDLWVKYADEMGFLNVAGSYSGAGATDKSIFESNRNDFAPKIRKLKSHVSTAIYTLANEIVWERNPSFLSLAEENLQFAQSIDPTHPIIANAGFGKGKVGDIEDIHDYTGWYGGTVLNMVKYEIDEFFLKDSGSKKPITFTECVGTYTGERTGRFHLWYNKGMSNALRHVGRGGQHPDDPLWYQKVVTKEMLEGMRRARGMESRIAGSFPFSDFWKWEVESKGFFAKPAAEVLKKVYSPILLSLKCWNRNVFAGDKIKGELYVVHDDILLGDLNGASVIITLVQNGRLLNTVEYDVPGIKYYATQKITVDLTIPENVELGNAKVIMTLKHEKARSVPNEMDIFVAPNRKVDPESIANFALYDPKGLTSRVLKDIGMDFDVVSDLQLLKCNSIVVGAHTLSTLSEEQIGNIVDFVDKGGRVMVMEQMSESLNQSLLVPEGIKSMPYSSLYVNTERPGLLDKEIPNRDFFLWDQTTRASGFPVINVFDIQSERLNSVSVLANCGYMLQYPVVLEFFRGKGSVIFSQLELIERALLDPVAQKVLCNLFNYLHSDQHTLSVQLNSDVTFANLDSEAGLFGASLKQGIVLNGHNYGKHSWEKYGWPDGRRVVGEQKITNGLGYTGTVNPSDTAVGFFFMRPPTNKKIFYLEVKNPVNKPLWFHIYLNDKTAGAVQHVAPNTIKQYGPWQLPEDDFDTKVTIVTPSDQKALKREKTVIEELVFQKILFQ